MTLLFHKIKGSDFLKQRIGFNNPYKYTTDKLTDFAIQCLCQDLQTKKTLGETDLFNDDMAFPQKESSFQQKLKYIISGGRRFSILLVKNSSGEIGYLRSVSISLSETIQYFSHQEIKRFFQYINHQGFILSLTLQSLNDKLEANLPKNDEFWQKAYQYVSKINDSESSLLTSLSNNAKSEILKHKHQITQLRSQYHDKITSISNKIKNINSEIDDIYQPHVENPTLVTDHLAPLKLKLKMHQQQLKKCHQHFEKEILEFKHKIKELNRLQNQHYLTRDEYQRNLQGLVLENALVKNQYHHVAHVKSLLSDKLMSNIYDESLLPALLNHAFDEKMKIIRFADFWYGSSPCLNTQNKRYTVDCKLRQDKQRLPISKSSFKTVLDFMLTDIKLEKSDPLGSHIKSKKIDVLYEDDDVIVLNKPCGLLSVPGKEVQDSMLTRLMEQREQLSGSVVVHRLDLATSGIIMFAKHRESHKRLQQQFFKKTIKKRYYALLKGILKQPSGTINIPICHDIYDRPRQKIDVIIGKKAMTNWQIIDIDHLNQETHVHFYPVTGRTHQLRVHAAYYQGLNAPIKGDELYGSAENRLYLHADMIEFEQPMNQKTIIIECPFIK